MLTLAGGARLVFPTCMVSLGMDLELDTKDVVS